MQLSTDEIKKWLKERKIKYSWLANQCRVSEGSVRNWFAKKHIPSAKMALIELLMKEENAPHKPLQALKNIPNMGKLFVSFTPELQEKIAQEALRQGMTPHAFISKLVEYYVTTDEGKEKAIKALSFPQSELETTYIDEEKNKGE
jgi:hypothetical protein|nr:MAG TPA: hypothetical protein [Caudoviricetes sp.]